MHNHVMTGFERSFRPVLSAGGKRGRITSQPPVNLATLARCRCHVYKLTFLCKTARLSWRHMTLTWSTIEALGGCINGAARTFLRRIHSPDAKALARIGRRPTCPIEHGPRRRTVVQGPVYNVRNKRAKCSATFKSKRLII
jgi:hypothetical protein